LSDARNNNQVPLITLFAAVAAVYFVNCENLLAVIAYRGEAALGWAYRELNPAFLRESFPELSRTYNASLAMQLFLVSGRLFSIDPQDFLPYFLFLEIALPAISAYFLSRTLTPASSRWPAVLTAVLFIASSARNINLARFHVPLFFGLYYSFADAARIAGVAFALRKQYYAAFFMLSLSMLIHPTMGLYATVFVLAAELPAFFSAANKWEHLSVKSRSLIPPALLSAALTVLWIALQFDSSNVLAAKLPADSWLKITEMGSYHWYPISFGVFTTEHAGAFLPFVTFLLLFGFFLFRGLSLYRRELIAGSAAMFVLIALGVLFSVAKFSPVLVKLALHRANDMILNVGVPVLAAGVYQLISEKRFITGMLGTALLFSCFVYEPPYAVLLAGLFFLCASFERPRKAGAIPCVALAAVIVCYWAAGLITRVDQPAYVVSYTFIAAFLAATLILYVAAVKPNLQLADHLFFAITVLGTVISCANFRENRPFLPAENKELAKSYLAVQLWAREHTAPDALFITDPSIAYGWIDIARRSTFGVAGNWLFESWAYNSDEAVFNESMRRLKEFDVSIEDYTGRPWPLTGYREATAAVTNRYYAADDNWRLSLAQKYGINFFVLRREKLTAPTTLPIAFQNDHFMVVATRLNEAD
jgi:hypothetical protein